MLNTNKLQKLVNKILRCCKTPDCCRLLVLCACLISPAINISSNESCLWGSRHPDFRREENSWKNRCSWLSLELVSLCHSLGIAWTLGPVSLTCFMALRNPPLTGCHFLGTVGQMVLKQKMVRRGSRGLSSSASVSTSLSQLLCSFAIWFFIVIWC